MEKEKGSRDDALLRRRLPDSICQLTEGKACRREKTVLRGSELLIFDDCVLKITPCSREDEESVQVMRWLEGKLPVPKVLACEKNKEYQYLLMSRIPGRKAWDDPCLAHPAELLAVLAEAVKALWRVDVSDCPRTRDADTLLLKAKYNVENNLADVHNVEPATYGRGGFENPQALLNWLYDNKPGFEPVLSHGDFCLSNILTEGGKLSGIIDLGETGVGDRWRDLALLVRSLKHNFDGRDDGKADPDMLFDALGIEPDRKKLRFYTLLDELF